MGIEQFLFLRKKKKTTQICFRAQTEIIKALAALENNFALLRTHTVFLIMPIYFN